MAGNLAQQLFRATGGGAPAQAVVGGVVAAIYYRSEPYDSGDHRISGDVGILGNPDTLVSRRVRLHDQRDGRLTREIWSDPVTGAFSFDRIRPGTYYVVTSDHLGIYNAVIKDRVQSEPMP